MDYKELNDNELLYLASENNEEATNLLIKKYKNIIITVIEEIKKKYQIHGIEISDLYQEGLIGLLNAIETFDKDKNILFYTYASVCIRSSIMSEIRRSFRYKHKFLNNSYSLDFLYDETKSNLYDVIKDEKSNPDNILMSKENELELISSVKKLLSKSELSIFELKIKGLNNGEIANLLDKDRKYVENTLFRINKKYRDYKSKL